jgi:exodeoxyribonuclease VII small subunit
MNRWQKNNGPISRPRASKAAWISWRRLSLESGDLPLDRSIELFEKGMALSESCRKQLEDAETRVEILLRKEGKIQPEPFRTDKP